MLESKWSLGQSWLQEAWPANLGPQARTAFRVQQDRAGSRPAPFPRAARVLSSVLSHLLVCSTNPSPTFRDLLKTRLAGHSGYREKGFSLKGDMRGTWARQPTKQPSVLATDRCVQSMRRPGLLGRMQTQHTERVDNSLCHVQCGWGPGHMWRW